MVDFFLVIIGLLCVHLVYKGIEVFQIAYVADLESPTRKKGLLLGTSLIALAFLVGITATIVSAVLYGALTMQLDRLSNFGK